MITLANNHVGNTFGTNAAGVVTTAGSSAVGQSSTNGSAPYAGTTYGSTLIGNNILGYHQIFATNVANGLGSGAPPSALSISGTLASFGFAAPMSAGTQLEVVISDINTVDNGGAYSFSGSISAVPEPAATAVLLAAGGLVAMKRRRLLA